MPREPQSLNVVKFGPKSYTLKGVLWDSDRQLGWVSFEDDATGIGYKIEALGLSPREQRQAVVDWILDNARP